MILVAVAICVLWTLLQRRLDPNLTPVKPTPGEITEKAKAGKPSDQLSKPDTNEIKPNEANPEKPIPNSDY